MPTIPHLDTDNGYSLRVGKHLPEHAANLAYVQADTPSPEKNIIIDDYTSMIPENKINGSSTLSYNVFTKENMLLESETGIQVFQRNDIDITDEYDVLHQDKAPLYFSARSNGLFDARLSYVYPYVGGNFLSNRKRFEETTSNESKELIYDSPYIRVTRAHGLALLPKERYKVKLVKDGEQEYSYRIEILSNFDIDTNSYEVHYNKINGNRNTPITEYLNFEPIFEKLPLTELQALKEDEKVSAKKFAIDEMKNGGYKVYAPAPSSEKNQIERNPHVFNYKIQADLSTRLSDDNPYEMKVGMAYLNINGINQLNVSAAAKRLFYNNPSLPSFLTFDNPHRTSGYNLKSDTDYWLIDLVMPKEHLLDYDFIIISGQGKIDLTRYSDAISAYLDNGGTLLIDSCSTNGQDLNLKPIDAEGIKFIRNINFTKNVHNTTLNIYDTPASVFSSRYYLLKNPKSIGTYAASELTFSDGEFLTDWDILIKHDGQGPSLIQSRSQYNGRLLYSAAGLMVDILFSTEETLKFFTNYLLYIAENKYYETPMFKEHVFYRDTLFSEEYKTSHGDVRYVDDVNKNNQTQIISKKILAPSIKEKMREYLPTYLRKADGNYHIFLDNESKVQYENLSFESLSSSGETSWTANQGSAIPGWNTVKFSGTSVTFDIQSKYARDGNYAAMIRPVSSRSFWEKDLGYLEPGDYEISVWIQANKQPQTIVESLIGLYDSSGVVFAQTEKVDMAFNWRQFRLAFTIGTSKQLYLRLGAHAKENTFTAIFDQIEFKVKNSVIVNEDGDGKEELYAYAISPKQQNYDITQWDQTNTSILIENTEIPVSIEIKSVVYQWSNDLQLYKKKYGNNVLLTYSVTQEDRIKELDKLISILPSMNPGAEWSDKSKVYYEISLLETDQNRFVNLELYDPTTQKYYYSRNGVLSINYESLRYDSFHSTVSLRAYTSYYGIRSLSRKFSLRINERKQLKVLPPRSTDERDRWYVQIFNGSFLKKGIDVTQIDQLSKANRAGYYETHLVGEHEYRLPEYDRQAYYPQLGERKVVAERATYVDRRNIQLLKTPVIYRKEKVVKETLIPTSSSRVIQQSKNNWWDKQVLPTIYWRKDNSSQEVIINQGYRIDYEEGQIEFIKSELPADYQAIFTSGTILASYSHNNFKIFRRKYTNERINQELLTTRDFYTFKGSHINWMTFPQPILYEGEVGNSQIVSSKEYYIDHETGTLKFFNEKRSRIYASYGYFTEEEIGYTDLDNRTGKIRLSKDIHFQDEIYVSYLYKEEYLDYKGYYDEKDKVFKHLDLNPTIGHTFTFREDINGLVTYVESPTEKLLGKEIYLYLLPALSKFKEETRKEEYCIRHALSEQEWLKIKQSSVEAVLLAKIRVRENTSIDNVVVMDARKNGGGIKESISQEDLEKVYGETSAFWDIGSFDGLTYYRNGVIVVQLPESILESNGGRFSENKVEEIVKKYIAFGVMPIIEYVEG